MSKEHEECFPCPLCMKIHEFTVPCFESLDPKFRMELMLEFREIDEVKNDRKELLSKNKMKFSNKTLEDMK